MRIAIVDDDPHLAELVKIWLEASGHSCVVYGDGREFINSLKRESFDLIILDWIMPDMDGEQVLNWLREQGSRSVPVIFVTQKDSEEDVARILNEGADDYITKPVREKELLARIMAVTRRSHPQQVEVEDLDLSPYHLNTASHSLSMKGAEIKLTQKEFELVLFLFRNIGRLLSRGHILASVWGHGSEFNTRTVDTHISRIRKKLDLNPAHGWKLTAIYHQGYRLERVEDAAA